MERRILAPVTAAIEEAEYGKNDQAADGEQHIPYGPTFRRLNLLLGTSINGAKITVLEETNGWCKFDYGGGKIGYISKDYVSVG